MNSAFKRNFAIGSATVISLLSTLSSVSAVTIPRPIPPIKGCTCMGRYFPPKICRVMRCAEASNSIINSDRRPLIQPLNNTQVSPISTDKNDLVAGRYRTRGPGGGIGRSADGEDV
ncbi:MULTISPECIES: hypothetical protein [Aerosakkonema]|uniref:hypothetical protein n=1 Tax=Aerosakkonema TaxID=1246629 RepID=UPI0035B8D479